MPETEIRLAELIEQVKRELLSTSHGQTKDAPLFIVNTVEIEAQITVKREGKAGVKIDVVAIGGGEIGGGISRDEVHKVKVTLSPLFNKEQLLELYKTFNQEKVPLSVKQSVDAFVKGSDAEDPNVTIT